VTDCQDCDCISNDVVPNDITAVAKVDQPFSKLLGQVVIPDAVLTRASELCMAVGADGLRGELTLMRSARALAALEGDTLVTEQHLRRVAPLALRHRLRRNVLDETGSTARIERAMETMFAA